MHPIDFIVEKHIDNPGIVYVLLNFWRISKKQVEAFTNLPE